MSIADNAFNETLRREQAKQDRKLKPYRVQVRETVIYTVEVRAFDSEMAEQMATLVWCDSSTPTEDFNGEGRGVEIHSVERL